MKRGMWSVRWRGVLLGTGMGVLILICGCAAVAGLMANGVVDLCHTGLLAAGILSAAALGGCLTAMLGGGSFADATLTAVGELVVLIVLNGVFNDWKMEGVVVTILVLTGGCGAALLLGMGRNPGRKQTRRRRRIR